MSRTLSVSFGQLKFYSCNECFSTISLSHYTTYLAIHPGIHPRRPPTPCVFNSLVNARTSVHLTFMSNGYRVPFFPETTTTTTTQLSSDPSWGWWRGQRRWWLVNLMLVMECDTEKIDSRQAFPVKHNGKPQIFVAVQVSHFCSFPTIPSSLGLLPISWHILPVSWTWTGQSDSSVVPQDSIAGMTPSNVMFLFNSQCKEHLPLLLLCLSPHPFPQLVLWL